MGKHRNGVRVLHGPLFAGVIILAAASPSHGVLISYNFGTDLSPTGGDLMGSSTAFAQVGTPGSTTHATGLGGTMRINEHGDSFIDTSYAEVTITPDAGFLLNPTSLTFSSVPHAIGRNPNTAGLHIDDVTLNGAQVVIPEPSTFILALMGLFVLHCGGWRRYRT